MHNDILQKIRLQKKFYRDPSVSEALTDISRHKFLSLDDIRVLGYVLPYPKPEQIPYRDVYLEYTNNFEAQLIKQGLMQDSWKYHLNPYSFRDKWDLTVTDKKKIGCFGDSFTFGDGLPSHEIHPHYLEELTQSRIFNVGKGGSSIERITRIFSVFTKFVNLDIAVFTLPHVYREFFIDPDGIVTDLIPNSRGNVHMKYMEPFFGIHENYQLSKLSFNINYILDIAAERNINVLFTTWDIPTHELLQIVAPHNIAEQIFPNYLDNKQARDLQHPGKLSQEKHAQNIMKELHDRTWI
jgi:hypothetical protein